MCLPRLVASVAICWAETGLQTHRQSHIVVLEIVPYFYLFLFTLVVRLIILHGLLSAYLSLTLSILSTYPSLNLSLTVAFFLSLFLFASTLSQILSLLFPFLSLSFPTFRASCFSYLNTQIWIYLREDLISKLTSLSLVQHSYLPTKLVMYYLPTDASRQQYLHAAFINFRSANFYQKLSAFVFTAR